MHLIIRMLAVRVVTSLEHIKMYFAEEVRCMRHCVTEDFLVHWLVLKKIAKCFAVPAEQLQKNMEMCFFAVGK